MAKSKPLTTRQIEVLRFVCDGLGHREIAEALNISLYTVHHHVEAVMRRLGIETTGRAGPACYRLGRIDEAAGIESP